MTYSKVDWESIHKKELFFVNECWSTCGSYCCSNNYTYFKAFRFLPSRGTTILYMEDEYAFLLKRNSVPTDNARTMTFNFGAEKPLRLIYTPCHYMGKCKNVITPPLLCKLYPYLPVFSINGTIEDICAASIYDLTFESRSETTPCTIKNKHPDFIKQLKENPSLLQLLSHPYIILYSRVAKFIADIYISKLHNDIELMSLKGEKFWEAWEIKYLSHQLIDDKSLDKLRQYTKEVYKLLKQNYQGFSL